MADIMMNVQEARTQNTFTALMWAFSHPGHPRPLPKTNLAPFFAIGETLVDLETSYYSSHDGLGQQLARLGGRPRSPQEAMYQFYPELGDADLLDLEMAPVGTYTYPDHSATLVLGVEFDVGTRIRLSGPGIPETTELFVEGIPQSFWSLREKKVQYPLGWDVFLIGDGQVVGLPRTTIVEVL